VSQTVVIYWEPRLSKQCYFRYPCNKH